MQYTLDKNIERQIFSRTESVLEFIRQRDFAAAVDYVGQIDTLSPKLHVAEEDVRRTG